MFDHLTIRVTDRTASERFYDTVLAPLGIDRTYRTGTLSEWQELQLTGADDTRPVTRRLHVGFLAPSRDQVAAFWRAGTEAGYPDDGRPGPRPEYRSDYYGAFPARSDGNSAEAVHHGGLRRGGSSTTWIRVSTGSFSLVRGRRPKASTWRFPQTTTPTSSAFIRSRPAPPTAATARPANARGTTLATTRLTCSMLTATTSKSSATTGRRERAAAAAAGHGRPRPAFWAEPTVRRDLALAR